MLPMNAREASARTCARGCITVRVRTMMCACACAPAIVCACNVSAHQNAHECVEVVMHYYKTADGVQRHVSVGSIGKLFLQLPRTKQRLDTLFGFASLISMEIRTSKPAARLASDMPRMGTSAPIIRHSRIFQRDDRYLLRETVISNETLRRRVLCLLTC